MADDGNKDKDFKVEDRRTASGGEGERQASSDTGEPSGEGVPGEASDTEAGSGGGESPGTKGLPKVDFSTFLLSLFSSALIQFGDMADPVTGEKSADRNLDAVSQTIDLLDLLREKTEGNLTKDELNFLNESTAQLKYKYFDAVKDKE
jgi:ribosomal protein L15